MPEIRLKLDAETTIADIVSFAELAKDHAKADDLAYHGDEPAPTIAFETHNQWKNTATVKRRPPVQLPVIDD